MATRKKAKNRRKKPEIEPSAAAEPNDGSTEAEISGPLVVSAHELEPRPPGNGDDGTESPRLETPSAISSQPDTAPTENGGAESTGPPTDGAGENGVGVIPEFEEAMRREPRRASFEQLLKVHFGCTGILELDDDADRKVYEQYYQDVFEAFQEANGDLQKLFFCNKTVGAVAVTKKKRESWIRKERFDFHLVFPTAGASGAQGQLLQCRHLSIEARRLLSGKDLQTCLLMIYDLCVSLLRAIDKSDASAELLDEEKQRLKMLRIQLKQVKAYHLRAAQLDAQIEYFMGMGIGLLVLPLLWLGLDWLLGNVDYIVGVYKHGVFVSLVAGSIGAVVSVMSRMMKSEGLTLNHEAGRLHLMLLGGIRPLIGAVFGVVVFALIVADLIPLKNAAFMNNALPTEEADKAQALFFFAVIAFLAGFSERWAQDMLTVGQGGLGAGLEEDEHEHAEEQLPLEERRRGAPGDSAGAESDAGV